MSSKTLKWQWSLNDYYHKFNDDNSNTVLKLDLKYDPNFHTSEKINFVTIIILIVISWIIVAFWTRALENLFFIYGKFNGESFWQTLMIAIFITILFISLVWTIESYTTINVPKNETSERIIRFGSLLSTKDFNDLNITQKEDFIILPID